MVLSGQDVMFLSTQVSSGCPPKTQREKVDVALHWSPVLRTLHMPVSNGVSGHLGTASSEVYMQASSDHQHHIGEMQGRSSGEEWCDSGMIPPGSGSCPRLGGAAELVQQQSPLALFSSSLSN